MKSDTVFLNTVRAYSFDAYSHGAENTLEFMLHYHPEYTRFKGAILDYFKASEGIWDAALTLCNEDSGV